MNREQLKAMGLNDEQIESVMKEHGKAIQAVKPADYENLKNANTTYEKQLKDLQAELDASKDLLSGTEDIKKELETYKLKNLKTSIAVEAGIPLELAGRLTGETEEELKADAENLIGFVGKKTNLPLKPTEPTIDEDADLKQMLTELTNN